MGPWRPRQRPLLLLLGRGPAAALMQRLDPRLRYLVTPEALEALEEQQGEGGGEDGGSDSDSDAGAPVVSTLSGISLQVRSCPLTRSHSVALSVSLYLCEEESIPTDASGCFSRADQQTSSV